jgi:hypothetical protein
LNASAGQDDPTPESSQPARVCHSAPVSVFIAWLGVVAACAMLAGIGMATNPFVTMLGGFSVAPFAILLAIPVPCFALWVGIRHLLHGRGRAAIVFALVPLAGTGVAVGSYEGSFHAAPLVARELRVTYIEYRVDAVRRTHEAITAGNLRIDPGPPIHATYDYSSDFLFAATELIVYDETAGAEWAQSEGRRCNARLIRLREYFFQIVGHC